MDVLRPDGSVETVHCANSGSMKSCLDDGCEVFTLDSRNDARKLRHSLELMRLKDGLACLNTARANMLCDVLFSKIVTEQALEDPSNPAFNGLDPRSRSLLLTDFTRYSGYKREASWSKDTRFDFHFVGSGVSHWLEVKSVSLLLEDSVPAFPDAVTERGQKHLKELTRVAHQGEKATLLFVLMRGADLDAASLAARFRIASSIDPAYGALFEEAIAAGVSMRMLVPRLTPEGMGIRGYFTIPHPMAHLAPPDSIG